ncbi:nucleotidyltransferase family protein [Micromonospora parathelypteridis]|uniref:Nicotine blue oxidoreductase n=1 Tax=Micromonospora parathelypteridis TaxID=1839617 RepID=A0A840W7U2_9ACTN|nr:nucleotidyltransferase family protein [Micromonospora parathelypteridis]MBB5480820.1 nicotine blue oxidoreductase [Micromonospora parathelypteridis]
MSEPRIAGLLLAGGAGRRYGMPKALVVVDGRRLVERGLATLRDAACDPVVVVLGAAAQQVRSRTDLSGATVTDNPEWHTGMGSSLRAGLTALTAIPVDAVAVLLVDTPGVTAAAVRRLRGLGDRTGLAVATYHGQPGHPVLLGRDHWPAVSAMAVGDVGARRYLTAHADLVTHVPCEDIADGTDLDVPRDNPAEADD